MTRKVTPRAVLAACVAASTGVGLLAALLDASWSAYALATAQTAAIAWLATTSLAARGTWATAAFVTAAAWFALFTVPGWIFAARPDLLARTTATPAEQVIGLTSIALLALIAGYVAFGLPARTPLPAKATASRLRPRALIAWFVAGLAGLGALFAFNGGPARYLSNLDKTGSMNVGLLYVIWLSQFMRYVPIAAVSVRWANGRPAGRALTVAAVLGLLAGALVGARAFVAVGAVQLGLTYALLRRPIPLRVMAPVALIAMLALIFGLGTVKRYANYQTANGENAVGFVQYATTIAPKEVVEAYATNYADGLRLVGLAVEAVPRYADHEGFKSLEDFALRAIPRAFRPELGRNPVLKDTFTPDNGTSLAVPLQATAYLAGGTAAVVLVFALLGCLISAVDRRLSRPEPISVVTWITLIALVVQIPILLRSGVPAGLLFLCLDVFAMWLVTATASARLTELPRRWPAPLHFGTGRVGGGRERAP